MTSYHAIPESYQAEKDSLNGHIILVTGAGDGIGKSMSLALAAHGATIVLAGKTLAKLEQTYDQIEKEGGAQPAIFPISLDLASEHDYQALKQTLESTFGRLDGLLHNAAELGPRTPLEQYPEGEWDKLMQANVKAPFMLTKTLMPLLKQSEHASVLFTVSDLAEGGLAYWGGYSVTNAAVLNLAQVFADELDGDERVKANIINPGATRTSLRARAYPAEDPDTVKSADELARNYIYLLSPASKGVNGQLFKA